MNISLKYTCSECHHDLTAKSTYAEDVDGYPSIEVEIEPCEACLIDEREQGEKWKLN